MTLLVKVMIAIREPAKANAILDQLALMNPTALVDAAAAAGIVNRGVRVDSALSFPVEYVEQKLFNQVRDLAVSHRFVDAIRAIRAGTGCGLKEGKDFVEHYWPGVRQGWR